MLEFTRMVTMFYSHIDRLPSPALQALFKGGATLSRLFGSGRQAAGSETSRESIPVGSSPWAE
jgi:hypothetical protein